MNALPIPSPDTESRQPDSYPDDVAIPIGAIVENWRRKRAVLAALFLTGAVASILLASSLYLLRPVSHQSILTFRLLFDGVEQGTYPNGDRFSPSDILATSVLEKVYARNELSRFIKFDDFKNGLSIAEYNPELNRLQREWQDRLAVRTQTPVEREKIETEFREKIAAIKNAEFTLVTSFGSRFKSLPGSLAGKVMSDALDTWVEESKDRGVFKFDLNIFSDNVLPANSIDEDYLVFVDRLRLSANRIKGNIEDLIKIPGAELLRVGPKNVSLGELRAALDDTLDYRIGTIDSCIIQFGFYRNKSLTEAYLNDQMFRHQLELDELNAQAKIIEGVEGNYEAEHNGLSNVGINSAANQGSTGLTGGGPMITQLSDTFIDRVMALSERSSDVAFRQNLANRVIAIQNKGAAINTELKLYQRQLAVLGGEVSIKENAAETKQWMERQLNDVLAQLKAILADVQTFNATLSQTNLEPSTVYTILGPVRAQTISTIGVTAIAVYSVLLGACIIGIGLVIVTWRGLYRV